MFIVAVIALCLTSLILNAEANLRPASFYKNLRLVSSSNGIAVQMNGTIFYVKRKSSYRNNDQSMFLSLPEDGCPVGIQYGKFVFQPMHRSDLWTILERLPEFKLFENKTSNDEELQKMKNIEPAYQYLIKYLFQSQPTNVRICHDLENRRCSNGISIKYETLIDFYELLHVVSDYYEENNNRMHLFMITDAEKLRKAVCKIVAC